MSPRDVFFRGEGVHLLYRGIYSDLPLNWGLFSFQIYNCRVHFPLQYINVWGFLSYDVFIHCLYINKSYFYNPMQFLYYQRHILNMLLFNMIRGKIDIHLCVLMNAQTLSLAIKFTTNSSCRAYHLDRETVKVFFDNVRTVGGEWYSKVENRI